MKLFVVLCFVVLVGLSMGETNRGCKYNLGKCVKECEEGTHSYAIGCDHPTLEATCDNPNPKKDESVVLCDFSACYCDAPTVRDTTTNKCVKLEDCPKKKE